MVLHKGDIIMENKRQKLTLGICVLLCTAMLIMCVTMMTGCGRQLTCKEYLVELCRAESFTVKNGDQTILKFGGNKMYWRNEDDEIYDEYYFYPDGSNKKWVYNKDFYTDSWIKMAMSDSEYDEYLIMIKNAIGVYEGVMDIIYKISLNFDSYMVQKDNKFALKPNMIEYVGLELWVEDDTLYVSVENDYLGNPLLLISDLNNTDVKLSTEVQTATIGTVSLP